MHALLNNPAVQAGFAPFLAALITAELFQRVKLSGLAIIAGFAIMIYLASDFTMVPLIASRKIVLLGLIGAALGLLLSLIRISWFNILLPVLGGAAAVWCMESILRHQTPQAMALWGAGCAAYVAFLAWAMDMPEKDAPRAVCAGTALGFGTGGAALFGAAALLGQFGLALGSAASAALLIQFISNKPLPTGRLFTLPLAMIAGLTGCLAVLSAQLPWYTLPILACIPIVARLVPMSNLSVRIQSILMTLLTSAFAAGAIYATWRVVGNIPL